MEQASASECGQKRGEGEETRYWRGTVGLYGPTHGASRRRGHNGAGSIKSENKRPMVPLPARTEAGEGTIKKAHNGRVPEVYKVEEGSGEGRDGGVVGTPLEKQKERERGCGGR